MIASGQTKQLTTLLFSRFLIFSFAISLLHAADIRNETSWKTGSITAPSSESSENQRWFRAWVVPQPNMVDPTAALLWRESVTLTIPPVNATIAVYINGATVQKPVKITEDTPLLIKIPQGVLKKDHFNAFLIHIQGPAVHTGLPESPSFTGYFEEIHIGPEWEFSDTLPTEDDQKPRSKQPEEAAYTLDKYQAATSPIQRPKELASGLFVPPKEALAQIKTTPDFIVEQLLHEPVVAQPTHISFDSRGRMWISQYKQYPYPAGLKMMSRDKFYRSKYDRVPPAPPHHDPGADIISIHTPAPNYENYPEHKNILHDLNMANAALEGFGGFWVMHTPYLLFYPDKDKDDIPDAPPEVRLAGFGLEDTHSVANGLTWGPDGWLYGALGSTTTSRITRPGIDPPDFEGIYNPGPLVWRYHPHTKQYEIFADGGGNAFGLSFDEEGRLYSGHNGGNTRGFHYIQEGVFLKQGKDPGKFAPPTHAFAFGDLPMMPSTHPVPRFTHLITLATGTALPTARKNQFFGIDPLHRRVVAATRIPNGASFSTTDVDFPLKSTDPTFRPVFLTTGPDGAIYIADFSEEHIAHGQNYQGQIDPGSGRIYRLRDPSRPLETDTNLEEKSNNDLLAFLAHPNQWQRLTAIRLLSERNAAETTNKLIALLKSSDTHPALEALWALHGIDALSEQIALETLHHPSPQVRTWTIRLLGDAKKLPSDFFQSLTKLATTEKNPETLCQILSTACRLPQYQNLPLVRALILHASSNTLQDPYLPQMAWLALEKYAATHPAEIAALFDDPAWWNAPLVKEQILTKTVRRLAAADSHRNLNLLAELLEKMPGSHFEQAALAGIEAAYQGRPLTGIPPKLASWLARSPKASLPLKIRQGDKSALTQGLKQLTNPKTSEVEKSALIDVFAEIKYAPATQPLLELILSSHPLALQKQALNALATFADDNIPDTLIANWEKLPAKLRDSCLAMLASRPTWTLKTIQAAEQNKIHRDAFPEEWAQRARSHQDPAIQEIIAQWFAAPTTTSNSSAQQKEIKATILSGKGNPYQGEAIYMEKCAACHKLFHKGGKIGPDLTPYQRDDLDTLLTAILDPNADIREGFETYLVTTTDQRALAGFLTDSDENQITLRSFDGTDTTLSRKEISSMAPTPHSMMPSGLLENLNSQEIRDFFAYLRQSQPITK